MQGLTGRENHCPAPPAVIIVTGETHLVGAAIPREMLRNGYFQGFYVPSHKGLTNQKGKHLGGCGKNSRTTQPRAQLASPVTRHLLPPAWRPSPGLLTNMSEADTPHKHNLRGSAPGFKCHDHQGPRRTRSGHREVTGTGKVRPWAGGGPFLGKWATAAVKASRFVASVKSLVPSWY